MTWSPVIITVLIPASLHSLTASFTSGRGGSIIPCRPIKVKSFSASFSSKISVLEGISLNPIAIVLNACEAKSLIAF